MRRSPLNGTSAPVFNYVENNSTLPARVGPAEKDEGSVKDSELALQVHALANHFQLFFVSNHEPDDKQ